MEGFPGNVTSSSVFQRRYDIRNSIRNLVEAEFSLNSLTVSNLQRP